MYVVFLISLGFHLFSCIDSAWDDRRLPGEDAASSPVEIELVNAGICVGVDRF